MVDRLPSVFSASPIERAFANAYGEDGSDGDGSDGGKRLGVGNGAGRHAAGALDEGDAGDGGDGSDDGGVAE